MTLATSASLLACGGSSGDKPVQTATAADVITGKVEAFERFDSKGGRFTVDLPPVWRGNYTVREGPDTSAGSRFRVEFDFHPDPAWKVDPKMLMVVRIFTKSAWEQVMGSPGAPVARRVADRGDDVFALSLPAKNPYTSGTPEASRYDELVLSVVNDQAGLRLTPK